MEILHLEQNNLMNQHRLGTDYPDSNSSGKGEQAGHELVVSPCRNKGYSLMGRLFGFTWHTRSSSHTLLGPPVEAQYWQTGGIDTVQIETIRAIECRIYKDRQGVFSLKEGKSVSHYLKKCFRADTARLMGVLRKKTRGSDKECNKEIPTACNGRILPKANHPAQRRGSSETVGSPSLETSKTGCEPEHPDPILRLDLLQTGHWIRWPEFFQSLCDLRKLSPTQTFLLDSILYCFSQSHAVYLKLLCKVITAWGSFFSLFLVWNPRHAAWIIQAAWCCFWN